jgi:aldehyde:ferredoxin oxidoreductase
VIRARVARLLERMADHPQYPTQGATLFVDLERQEVRGAHTPREVVETFLEGRGANMFYLYNLLDPTLEPLDPAVPLQLSAGLLTGIVPSASRGQVTGWSPESRVLMDSSCGDHLPSYLKLGGIDRLVLYGRAPQWTYLYIRGGRDQPVVELRDARPYVGLDNIDLRARIERDLGATWGKDLAMANITRAAENGVLLAGIMGGPKAIWARGGTGAKMASLGLKAIVVHGFDARRGTGASAREVKPQNRVIARKLLGTGVVKHALSIRGTPFLYRPSRLLGTVGARNNQETTWTEKLDAENFDPYRPGMTGCYGCPVNCRPLNDVRPEEAARCEGDRHDAGEGPDYVTLGKLGPMIGIEDPRQVLRLNNIANDLGLDTASLGSSIAWAMELFQRGTLSPADTGGLDLAWGNYPAIEKLFFQTAAREGFGDVIADGARAVDTGKYPPEALDCRMAVKGLFQSDPHDARVIKAFALGLAVATRGMDHLRNRATLEINPRINDDPDYKRLLYGGPVAAAPHSYEGKELTVRVSEDHFAVGDAVGLCRFTTRFFNSPNLPGYDELSQQILNVTGLRLAPSDLAQIGLNITGLERMINHSLGVRRKDDTLPRRWFEEEVKWGTYIGEKIDRAEFEKMLDRFYELSGLDAEGQPRLSFRARLAQVAVGFAVEVRLPPSVRELPEGGVLVTDPVTDVRGLVAALDRSFSGLGEALSGEAFVVSVNDEVVLRGRDDTPVKSGDRIEFLPALAGG